MQTDPTARPRSPHRRSSTVLLGACLAASLACAPIAGPAAAAGPDVVVVRGDAVTGRVAPPEARASRLLARDEGGGPRLTLPSHFYVLPLFKVDPDTADGETTLLAVRNEHVEPVLAKVELLDPSTLVSFTVAETLAPKQVWTLNLRDWVIGTIPADIDGLIRGVARVTSPDGPISADRFQIVSGEDFASGGLLADVDGGDFCRDFRVRFLVGGAFSGGTRLTLVLDTPLGDDPLVHPPSVTGTFYPETASIAAPIEIYTSRTVIELDVADLIDTVSFGSMDLRFEAGLGGYVEVEHRALGRYSVSVPGVCLDPPPVRRH